MKKYFLILLFFIILHNISYSQKWEYKEGIYIDQEYQYGTISGEIFGENEKPVLVFRKMKDELNIFIINNTFSLDVLEEFKISFDSFNIKYHYKYLKIERNDNVLFIPITKDIINDFKNKHVCYIQLIGKYNYDILFRFPLDKSKVVINKILK